MKAIELYYGAGLLGTNYTHYASDVLTPGEVLFTRDGARVSIIKCVGSNECTSLDPQPAYKCKVVGVEGSCIVYDREMLEHLNR